MTERTPGRVAIFGGGMAGLATAWELSRGDWQSRYQSITVYQRGWRLGGKGASSRGTNGRIEEHGLHLLLGYYHASFRLMDEVYRELDRPRNRPDCPVQTWADAVQRAPEAGVVDDRHGHADPWWASFPVDDSMPGTETADPDEAPFSADALRRAGQLLLALSESLRRSRDDIAILSAHRHPPTGLDTGSGSAASNLGAAFGLPILLSALAGAEQAVEMVRHGDGQTGVERIPAVDRLADHVFGVLEDLAVEARLAVDRDPRARRTADVVDLLVISLIGLARDRVLANPSRIRELDAEDYRHWLARHGASETLLASPLLRGLYDLVFAYEQGDPDRPRFAAGVGLELAARMFLHYRGALFWHMTAGMGEIIFAPLYEGLRRRGVTFAFFHRLDELTCDDAGSEVITAELTRQVERGNGYEPLIDADGLPAWPDRPDPDQVGDLPGLGLDLESAWSQASAGGTVTLARGVDFDVGVLAVPLGAVAAVTPGLVERLPRWRAMTTGIGTVSTQSFQVWCREDERALGWSGRSGVTVSGHVEPFDTWASMSHLIERENWPVDDPPRSIGYFCSALDGPPITDGQEAGEAKAQVRANAVAFLKQDVSVLWPAAASTDDLGQSSFRWSLLCDGRGEIGTDHRAFDSQYWRANVDPSDRYVQSLPGTNHLRMAPGGTGIDGLVVAGDWTDCGLNAGCLEAATRSGILAAGAVADAMERNRPTESREPSA